MWRYTSTTELARKGRKAFEWLTYSTVMCDNKDIWMIVWKDLARALEDSGVLQQIREELWELNDPETVELVEKSRKGELSDSITLEGFRKQHNV